MSNLLFWNNWSKVPKYLYSFLLFVFVGMIITLGITYYQGGNIISEWVENQELDLTKTKIGDVHTGMFSIPIDGELHLNYGKYLAGDFRLPVWVYTAYGIILVLITSFLLSIITTLRSMWFAIGMTIFIFYLSTMNLDYIVFWGKFTQLFLLLSLVIYIGISYYLHSYIKKLGLGWRVLIFGVTTLLIGSVLTLNSTAKSPLVHLINYSAWVPLILTLLFITVSAHDIVRGFFHLIIRYNPQGGKSNLLHFSVITFVYLLNLFLIFLKERGTFVIDIYYLDVYWLFILGAILGVWGYQQRKVMIQGILPFDYQAAFGYICMAILAVATISFYMITGNDAMTDVFKDFILYSYIGFGVTFYVYVMINFSNLIGEKADISAFLYEGKVIPLNTIKYFGLIIILGFFLNVKQMLYYQSVSGYFNGLGDIYFHQKDYKMAELYYTKGLYNDFLNHRSNFTLAHLAQLNNDKQGAFRFLKTAVRRQASEQAYAKMSASLLENDKKIDALFTLREAVLKFPRSQYLLNNLAELYKINNIPDSTLFYLEEAQKYGNSNLVNNNIWAYLAEKTNPGDSVQINLNIDLNSLDVYGKVNALAYFAKNEQKLNWKNQPMPLFKEANAANYALLQNYTYNQIGEHNPRIDSLIQEFNQKDSSAFYSYRTQFLQACYEYYSGRVYSGIQSLASIPVLPSHGYYNSVLGLWLLEQQAYAGAISYFDKAIELKNKLAPFYKAIALSEAHRFEEALPLWSKLTVKDEDNPDVAQFALRVLRVFEDSLSLQDDIDKYNFLHYKKHLISEQTQREVYNSMEDANYRVRAGVEMAQYYLNLDSLALAGQYVENINAIEVNNPIVASEQNLINLRMGLKGMLYEEILNKIDQVKLTKLHHNQVSIIQAHAYEMLGKVKESEEFYLKALESSPFDEETVLRSAKFFQEIKKDNQKAYDILVNSVRSNPFSLRVYKAYALIAPKVGLAYYGEDALEEIRKLTTKEDYQNFKKEFDKVNDKEQN